MSKETYIIRLALNCHEGACRGHALDKVLITPLVVAADELGNLLVRQVAGSTVGRARLFATRLRYTTIGVKVHMTNWLRHTETCKVE